MTRADTCILFHHPKALSLKTNIEVERASKNVYIHIKVLTLRGTVEVARIDTSIPIRVYTRTPTLRDIVELVSMEHRRSSCRNYDT